MILFFYLNKEMKITKKIIIDFLKGNSDDKILKNKIDTLINLCVLDENLNMLKYVISVYKWSDTNKLNTLNVALLAGNLDIIKFLLTMITVDHKQIPKDLFKCHNDVICLILDRFLNIEADDWTNNLFTQAIKEGCDEKILTTIASIKDADDVISMMDMFEASIPYDISVISNIGKILNHQYSDRFIGRCIANCNRIEYYELFMKHGAGRNKDLVNQAYKYNNFLALKVFMNQKSYNDYNDLSLEELSCPKSDIIFKTYINNLPSFDLKKSKGASYIKACFDDDGIMINSIIKFLIPRYVTVAASYVRIFMNGRNLELYEYLSLLLIAKCRFMTNISFYEDLLIDMMNFSKIYMSSNKDVHKKIIKFIYSKLYNKLYRRYLKEQDLCVINVIYDEYKFDCMVLTSL